MGRGYEKGARRAAGFTLLEMMLVVVIIGLLATVVVVNLGGQSDAARQGVTITRMSQIKSALTQYQMRHGSYPQFLGAVAGPSAYLEKLPQDGWKSDFYYNTPGQVAGQPYDLVSPGMDKALGTPDDINVWTMDEGQ